MRFKLTAKENQNTGEIGWQDSRIRGSDVFEPLSEGLGLAHDCMEHTAFGSVADEIEAHGAMYWVRYEGGWQGKYGSNLNMEGFASEWQNLLNGLMSEPYLPDTPKTLPLDSQVEEDISSIIQKGKVFCIRNEVCECQREDSDSRKDLERLSGVFRAFFRRGYRKAIRRYKGLPAYEVAALFSELEKAFDRQRAEYEGQELAVTVDLRERNVRIEEIY